MKRPSDYRATIGVVTLHNVFKETKPNRRIIAKWLRNIADEVEREGDLFGKKYQAHLYEPK